MDAGERYLDLVCVGCGPSNLALAAAVQDTQQTRAHPLAFRLLEQKDRFSWHPGMQLPDSDCQVSFLKDLATLRNPRSEFTFLNYLHSAGKLLDFIELGQSAASRDDFAAYFAWAADRLGEAVSYGAHVELIEPIRGERGVSGFRVHYRTGAGAASLVGRHVCVAVGGQAFVPKEALPAVGPRCFHSDRFLSSLRALGLRPQDEFCVTIVGGGQSAVDIATYLLVRYAEVRVTVLTRGYSFRTADDNPFLNKFFTVENAASIYALPPERRVRLAEDYFHTGVAVADMRLVRRLYDAVYRDRATGRSRFTLVGFREVCCAEHLDASVRLRTRNVLTGTEEDLTSDLLVLATGYSRSLKVPFLRDLEELIYPNGASYPSLEADYSVTALKSQPAALFLQGYAAYTHGVGDEALSLISMRADVIKAAIDRRNGDRVREARLVQHR
jgi:lysine/ornithine N-monooxygenase